MKQQHLLLLMFLPMLVWGQETENNASILRFGLLLFPEATHVSFEQTPGLDQQSEWAFGFSIGGQVQLMLGKGISARMGLLRGERQYMITESGKNVIYVGGRADDYYSERELTLESTDFQLGLGYEFGNEKEQWAINAGIAYHIYERANVTQHYIVNNENISIDDYENKTISLQDNGNLSGFFSLSYGRYLGRHFLAFAEPTAYLNLRPLNIETMESYRFMGVGVAVGVRYLVGGN